jgi:chromosome segregation ATPase
MSADEAVSMLMQDEEELVEKHQQKGDGDAERPPSRAEMYEMIRDLRDTVESQEERIKELEREKESFDDAPELQIEREARNPDHLLDLSANRERAVKIWRDLGEYADGTRDKLTLNYSQIADAIHDVENMSEEETVNSNTVKRVREAMSDMSGGIASVKKLKGKRARKRYGVIVPVRAWARMRPDTAVEEQLPPKIAEALTEE